MLIDVNVGLPRCGCSPADAGGLAELARAAGLEVRGVMGYEGHTMMVKDRADRARQVAESMALLEQAHAAVGGPDRSAGGTGSWDLNALGDRAPGRLLRADGHRLRRASGCPSGRP